MDAMERRCQIIEILCDAKMHVKMRDLLPGSMCPFAPSERMLISYLLHTQLKQQEGVTTVVSVL